MSWMLGEWIVRRSPSLLGLCSGLVAGLVAITPAAGFVTPPAALAIGAIAGLACYWGATGLKHLLGADDSLDVFGVHGIGGIVGALLTGVFADARISGATGDVLTQAIAVGSVAIFSAAGTAVVLFLVHVIVGLRVDADSEQLGLDLAQHREHLGSS